MLRRRAAKSLTMSRFFAAIVFLFGLALAVGYPLLSGGLPPLPIGTRPVYEPAHGFMPVAASLRPQDIPVEVYLDLVSAGSPKFDKDSAVLTLTASADGKTVLAVPLSFEGA